MQYRELGRTGLRVSAIGLGCAMIGNSTVEYATRIVHRAIDLGVNYFDTARGYWDSEAKLGVALEGGLRERVVISTKTGAKTRDAAWQHIQESLQRLRTAYLDNCHLHGLATAEDAAERTGPGGALEALIEAKRRGLIRHIGCTSHRSDVLIAALERFDFEIILVPMNIVETEPLETLIPLCHERGVGVTIMKPLATGLLPAPLALKWLLNQPIATAVPGASTLAEVEENSKVGHGDATLSAREVAEAARLRRELEHERCRICDQCLPCAAGINIPEHLGTDVMFDHLRTMGREGFLAYPWSRDTLAKDLESRQKAIAAIEACDHCGDCESRCPHGLPVMAMLGRQLPAFRDMVGMYGEMLRT